MNSRQRPPGLAAEPTELQRVLRAQRPALWQAGRLSFVIGMLMLVPSWFMFEVYGRVLDSRSHSTLYWLLLLVIGSYIVQEVIDVARGRVLYTAAEDIDRQLRERVFNTTFLANLRKMQGTGLQVFTDLKAFREVLYSPVIVGLLDIPAAIVCLGLLFLISPWLGLMALVGALIQAWLGWITERRTMPQLQEATGASIQAQAFAGSAMRNAQVIESMGMIGALHRRYMQRQKRFIARQAQASDTASFTSTATKLVQTMQGSLLLGGACYLTLHDSLLGGAAMMIVASILGGRALAPSVQIVANWRNLIMARDAYQRLNILLQQLPEAEPGLSLPPPKGVLTVEAVVAAPPGSTVPILKGLSFAALPGEVTMIIGPSASGKTTLARMVMGLWPASSGKVRLDSADVYAWDKAELGPHLGYLPQGVELFDGTIAENIARFGKVDLDKVKAAAELAGITELVESLPQGWHTRIGDEGAFLSGGQRQRVGLARALYGEPQLIVLDEPNASLDEAGEKQLLQALMQLKQRGATVLAITHRTTLLPAADKLLVLNDGSLLMFGKRDEVLAALAKANQEARAKQMQATPRPNATTLSLSPGAKA
jgi:ATP-binding cassette, subfamily C, bacterial exporter for protease/lipase